MVRLETAKGSKVTISKLPSSKSNNKENSSPNSICEPDPYADDSQVMDWESPTLVPAAKVKTCRLKKASGRFQCSKSASPPLAERSSINIIDVPKSKKADLEKPSEPQKRKSSLKATKPGPISQSIPNSRSKIDTKPVELASTTAPNKRSSGSTKETARADSNNSVTTHHNSARATKSESFEIMVPEKTAKIATHSTARSTAKTAIAEAPEKKQKTRLHKSKTTATKSFAQHQVFISKDMLLLIAQFLPGLELVRLSLSNTQIQGWLSDPNHRLWQVLCVAAYKKFRFPKRDDDSWKRRYLQSLAICEACDFYCPSGGRGAVVACVWCSVQYCGFNPPPGHVRFPSTPSVKPVAPRTVGMCYEQCWALCWRCNDLIVMQNAAGQMGAVCRGCCPPDRDVCDQCRETILLARTKPQWQTRRDEHKVARVLGLNDTSMGEFVMELEDDNRSVTSQYRYERPPVSEESILETSTIFDPYF